MERQEWGWLGAYCRAAVWLGQAGGWSAAGDATWTGESGSDADADDGGLQPDKDANAREAASANRMNSGNAEEIVRKAMVFG